MKETILGMGDKWTSQVICLSDARPIGEWRDTDEWVTWCDMRHDITHINQSRRMDECHIMSLMDMCHVTHVTYGYVSRDSWIRQVDSHKTASFTQDWLIHTSECVKSISHTYQWVIPMSHTYGHTYEWVIPTSHTYEWVIPMSFTHMSVSGSFLAEIFPVPGPGFDWGLRLLIEGRSRIDATSHFRHISSHSRFNVTLPGVEKVCFSTSNNVTIFLELGTNVTISSHRHIVTSFFGLKQSLVSKAGQVLGPSFPISAWNDPHTHGSHIWMSDSHSWHIAIHDTYQWITSTDMCQ